MIKKYRVQCDVTYTKVYFVTAYNEEDAKNLGKNLAWEQHHGEVINHVDVLDAQETEEKNEA